MTDGHAIVCKRLASSARSQVWSPLKGDQCAARKSVYGLGSNPTQTGHRQGPPTPADAGLCRVCVGFVYSTLHWITSWIEKEMMGLCRVCIVFWKVRVYAGEKLSIRRDVLRRSHAGMCGNAKTLHTLHSGRTALK